MKIGIIGSEGVVGSACKFGFEKVGHTVIGHDLSLGTKIKDVLDTKICYICVPTPSYKHTGYPGDDGACDTSIVEDVVADLAKYSYKGIVAIKSTVPPGTTQRLYDNYFQVDIFADLFMNPETLRERCAVTDFVELHNVLIIGSTNLETQAICKECHGDLPKNTLCCTPTQAELIKYYNNCFGALRVSFANEFFELCKSMGEEYIPVKQGLIKANEIPDKYLDVNDNVRGWSSICWNKDLPAILHLAEEQGVEMPMVQAIVDSNEKYKSTPFKNTREEY